MAVQLLAYAQAISPKYEEELRSLLVKNFHIINP
jgi:hypothetical protein